MWEARQETQQALAARETREGEARGDVCVRGRGARVREGAWRARRGGFCTDSSGDDGVSPGHCPQEFMAMR